MEVAIAGVGTDTDAARLRKFDGVAHDIGIAGMKAAGDVHRRRKLDHRGVVAHFPRAKSFAEIAIEVDGCHVVGPLLVSGLVGQSGPAMSARVTACQVPASTALTAWPATLASCSASMLRSTLSIDRSRSGRVRSNAANLRASAWASAMLTARKRKARPAGICANRPKSAEITVAILGYPPLVPRSRISTIGWPLPGTCRLLLTVPSETMLWPCRCFNTGPSSR